MSELTRLGSAVTSMNLDTFKRDMAKRRGQDQYRPVQPPEIIDYRFLTPRNLEANGWIEPHHMFLMPRDVAHCGDPNCANGQYARRCEWKIAPKGKWCVKCQIPRDWLARLKRARIPSTAAGMHFKQSPNETAGYDFSRFPELEEYANKLINRMKRKDTLRRQKKNKRKELWSHEEKAAEEKGAGLMLCGSAGTGKSSFMYSMAREASFYGHEVKIITHNALRDQVTDSWNNRDAKDPMSEGFSKTSWLAGVDMLFLDEFGGIGGSSVKSGWWSTFACRTIEQIHAKWSTGALEVVISTNLLPNQIKSVVTSTGNQNVILKDPNFDRINEMVSPFKMFGESRRVSAAPIEAWN